MSARVWHRTLMLGAWWLALSGVVLAQGDDGANDVALVESAPLAPRGDGPGDTLFQLLSADETGIDFVHRWTRAEQYQHVLGNAMAGGGVALGDYDGDGLADVFLTRPEGGNRLYSNLGGMRFEDVTETAGLGDGGGWGGGCSFVDVEGDGDLDLYVCGYDTHDRFYVNQGDGTFVERARELGIDFKGASVMASFADYDRDGDVDLFLLTNRYAGRTNPSDPPPIDAQGRVRIPPELAEKFDVLVRPGGQQLIINAGQLDHLYRNDDGVFTDVSEEAGISGNHFGLSSTWWDFDDDGHPDLHVANDFFGPDRLYHNQGDGTFVDVAATALPHTPWFSMGADVADIDNDGRLDLMASDMAATTRIKRKVNVGDMEDTDWFLEASVPPQYMRNAVYLNTGTMRFMEVAHMTSLWASDWTWAIKFGDLDNDGLEDVFISNGMTRDYFNSDLREASMVQRQSSAEFLLMEDFWIDKAPLREANLAFRNLGELAFEDVSAAWGVDHVGVTFGASLGDLDGDGDLDLVVNNYEEPPGVYRNTSTDGHRVVLRLVGRTSNRDGLGAVVRVTTPAGRQTRYHTLSRGYMAANDPRVHFGLGAHETIGELTVEWPSGHVQRLRDLAADRSYTITEPEGAAASTPTPPTRPMFTSVMGPHPGERPHDDFARQPLLPYKLSQLGPSVASADVNGDGQEDLFLGGPAGQQAGIFVSSGPGAWSFVPQPALNDDRAREDMGSVFLDADSDGDLDLFVASGGTESDAGHSLLADRLYLNDGSGRFSKTSDRALPPHRDSSSAVAAADFDRDGDVDLFVGSRSVPGEYPRTPASHLLRNQGGAFADVTDDLAPGLGVTGLVTGAVWSDADGDGWIDLLVTHDWGPVKLWRNEGGRLVDATDAAGLAARTGWWNGIAARDVDGDDDIDYLVTNLGLNTRYRATADEPALLFAGDYDGSGLRLVEAEWDDGALYPLRGRSATIGATPFLSELYPSYGEFARATLADLYTAEGLEQGMRLEAVSFETGVLLNDGEARFDFRPLPRIAQASPGFGVVLTEVDGDGHADAYIVQNFHGPQRRTGRMDGGVSQLLLGRGDGTFAPVPADESGLLVPGDGKSLATAHVNDDAWVDFLVGVNDGPLVAWVRRPPIGGDRVVSVGLRGRRGNPTGIGARVTLVRSDGARQTAEVTAGSGYLSQGSPRLVFGLGKARVERLDVRWPTGETTSYPMDVRSGKVEVEQP